MRQEESGDFDADDANELRAYAAAVIKRKWIVLGVFALSVALAAARGASTPALYAVSMEIAPPSGSGVDLESVGGLKNLIEGGAFDASFGSNPPRWTPAVSKDGKSLKVGLTVPADRTEEGLVALQALKEAVRLNYAKTVDENRLRIENRLKLAQGRLAQKEREIALRGEQLAALADQEKACVADIQKARADADKLLAGRPRAPAAGGGQEPSIDLLYFAATQQSESRLAQLRAELVETRIRIQEQSSAVASLKNGLSADAIEIGDLKASLSGIHNVAVLQEPSVSGPSAPGHARKMTAAAGAAGLIVGLLAALWIEDWKNSAA
ncbi:MAG: hypothetical protein ACHQ51_08595 [Elusimicrobiota bacterium]